MEFDKFINKLLSEDLSDNIKDGIEVEKEHKDIYNELKSLFKDEFPWSLDEFSEMIARDHDKENPKYYKYLKDMEKKMDSDEVKAESMSAGGTGGQGIPPFPFPDGPGEDLRGHCPLRGGHRYPGPRGHGCGHRPATGFGTGSQHPVRQLPRRYHAGASHYFRPQKRRAAPVQTGPFGAGCTGA